MKGPNSSSIDLKPNDGFINIAEVILIGLNVRSGSGLTVSGASDTCPESRAKLTILAQERDMAVIVNRPFQRGALIDRLRG